MILNILLPNFDKIAKSLIDIKMTQSYYTKIFV